MEENMRIVLDAMGSDNCPHPEVQAASKAAFQGSDQILLVGPAAQLKPLLERLGNMPPNLHLVEAPDTISMQDKGLKLALKAKRRNAKNSMAVGMDLLKNSEADAFVTAGNTGGALTTAFFRLGVLTGVERPALTTLIPVRTGFCTILDIGANPDCKPEHLLQFAVMGSVFSQVVRGVSNPKIGLLSNGEEAGKGNELVRNTYPLLEKSGLNYIGNVEGKEVFGGEVDVVITDGFTGNVFMKGSEAVAKLLTDILKEELMSSTRSKLGALLAKPAFASLKNKMDPDEIGAAVLLGINGLVFVGHGRSNARALVSAIRTAHNAVEADLLSALKTAIQERLANLPSQELQVSQ
jgi:phosphate acyltransferase